MAHAQKPDFCLSAKRASPFKLAGASVQSTTGSRGTRVSGSNAGYTMFRGSVKGTGYPFHSPVSPSVLLSRVTVPSRMNWSLQLYYLVLFLVLYLIITGGFIVTYFPTFCLTFIVTVFLVFLVLKVEYQYLHFYLFSITELPSVVLICLGVGCSGSIFVFA